ncbi:MAG TPA: hypothetical protein VHT51_18005 [Micropepsaceae bacterium]|jgi:hypothetical protein|nr:hypothetical protein [Micropepsaceae bacterium]
MKSSLRLFGSAIVAASTLALSAAMPVQAQNTPGGNVCLNVTEIYNTQAIDKRTILYRMRDGKIWRNTLTADCPTLVGFDAGGFTQVAHTDFICANTQLIKTQSGNVCRLGAFTREK